MIKFFKCNWWKVQSSHIKSYETLRELFCSHLCCVCFPLSDRRMGHSENLPNPLTPAAKLVQLVGTKCQLPNFCLEKIKSQRRKEDRRQRKEERKRYREREQVLGQRCLRSRIDEAQSGEDQWRWIDKGRLTEVLWGKQVKKGRGEGPSHTSQSSGHLPSSPSLSLPLDTLPLDTDGKEWAGKSAYRHLTLSDRPTAKSSRVPNQNSAVGEHC